MANWQPGESIFVSGYKVPGGTFAGEQPASGTARETTGGGGNPPLAPDWKRWVAENVLLNKDPRTIHQAMVDNGIAAPIAAAEVQAALNHPYVAAARKLGVTGAGAAAAAAAASGSVDAKVKKRDWVLELMRRTARQHSTFGQVPRVVRPSRQEFLDNYYALNRPVVIQGAMDDWPAMTKWTSEALKQRLGDRVVEVQANRETDANYEQNSTKLKKDMTFGEYIDTIEAAGETNNYYITANNSGKNKEALKELWDDIVLFPEYLRTDDPANNGFFWFGPKGTVTPLHHDLTNNFMAQVRGRKLVRLIAPYDLANVYNNRHCYSPVNLDKIDFERYPLFRQATITDVVIGPGDVLFLPIGWWHYVRGLDISITMTFTNFVFDNDFYSFYTTYQDI